MCLLGEGLGDPESTPGGRAGDGGRDVRRGHSIQGGTTGSETSAHPLGPLGTSLRLVQPFPSWHS